MNKVLKKKRRIRVPRGRGVKAPPRPAQPFAQHAFASKVEFINGSVPKVLMTREVHSQMWHFVDIAQEEVSWLGVVRVMPRGDYLIEEVFLLEQEVTSVMTELSTDGVAALAQDLLVNRKDGAEIVNRLLFWGHSHVEMGTFASGQDSAQMDQFRENGSPWFIRGIFNKLGRMEFAIFLWEAGIKIMDAQWGIYEPVNAEMRASIEADFKAKVARKTYQQTSHVVYTGGEQPHYMPHPEFAGVSMIIPGPSGSGASRTLHLGSDEPEEQFHRVGHGRHGAMGSHSLWRTSRSNLEDDEEAGNGG